MTEAETAVLVQLRLVGLVSLDQWIPVRHYYSGDLMWITVREYSMMHNDSNLVTAFLEYGIDPLVLYQQLHTLLDAANS